MSPKVKYTHDDIVKAAFEVVRRGGIETLSARAIAKELNSSTMPIYSYLKSMKDLEAYLMEEACAIALKYQTTPHTNDTFMDMAIGYVMFARNEKHLFRLFNDPKYREYKKQYEMNHMETLAAILADSPRTRGLSKGQRLMLILKGWIFAYGLANLLDISDHEMVAALREDNEKLIALIEEIDKDLNNSCHAVGEYFMTMQLARY